MSRKKRVKDNLLAKHKKKNARMHKNNKPKYISKAERAKMEEEQAKLDTEQSESVDKPEE
ncbi:hypothetical protein JCM19232_792 [Vibrio ishigakensis]|uniref:DUF2986 domain-containing protein n=1 Tax=Vibrio ishigakensis TaxID=1481914 RepID=A0A0B8PC48_9VIBR|nr:hypothetical protein JCM19232_792 [Vibrio ishigakensis]